VTTRQIADVVGKTERCVHRWAKNTGATIFSIHEKLSKSGHGKPVYYDLTETMAIITTGMGVFISRALSDYVRDFEKTKFDSEFVKTKSLNDARRARQTSITYFRDNGLSIRQVPTEMLNLKIQHITLIREIRSKKEALNV